MTEIPPPELWREGTFQDLQTLYEIYRDYMKHEDDLLNQRTSWFLVIQGFLFATYGVAGEWVLVPGVIDLHYIERKHLVYVLAFVGFSIAVAAFLSILAANNAIDSLCVKWKRILDSYTAPMKELLPNVAGGGHKTAKKFGKLPAVCIPVIVAIAWLAIAGMAWREYKYPSQVPASTAIQPNVSAVPPQLPTAPMSIKP